MCRKLLVSQVSLLHRVPTATKISSLNSPIRTSAGGLVPPVHINTLKRVASVSAVHWSYPCHEWQRYCKLPSRPQCFQSDAHPKCDCIPKHADRTTPHVGA
ncbi:hypothetical protein PISMIDRAFT_223937 [Pisolithus microcarpus 441]|uniref:Uncharacterized protein n=1 Tax=Pisolithus microcarpus 441 TaxID=765257 RepID=A0A0C9Z4V0_9AGAM|nr:hypothetical protein PISMIDRAFT_223937 [Pisolithus microcarpus 441]